MVKVLVPRGMMAAAAALWLGLALPAAGAPASPSAPSAGDPAAVSDARPVVEVIAGLLVRGPKGPVLQAQDGDYLVRGLDLGPALGKRVEITGLVSDDESELVLNAKSYTLLP